MSAGKVSRAMAAWRRAYRRLVRTSRARELAEGRPDVSAERIEAARDRERQAAEAEAEARQRFQEARDDGSDLGSADR